MHLLIAAVAWSAHSNSTAAPVVPPTRKVYDGELVSSNRLNAGQQAQLGGAKGGLPRGSGSGDAAGGSKCSPGQLRLGKLAAAPEGPRMPAFSFRTAKKQAKPAGFAPQKSGDFTPDML
jgi:hypothetical protein